MVKSIPLLDGTIVVMLSNGPVTITPETYNYNKILENLPTTTEDDILALLVTPSYPDGIFKFYAYFDQYVVFHYSYSSESILLLCGNVFKKGLVRIEDLMSNGILLGTYTSIDEIRYDFPELFL